MADETMQNNQTTIKEQPSLAEEDSRQETEEGTATFSLSKKALHPMEVLMKKGWVATRPKTGDVVEGEFIEKLSTRLFVDLGVLGIGLIYGKEYYASQSIIKDLKPGDKISAKVVEPDNEEGYIELSLKDAGEERRWVDLENWMREGKNFELPVKEANRGGIILELSGVKGFLPASQLSSKNYPRVEGGDKEKVFEALQKLIGQTIKVKILDIGPMEGKLIFSEKELDSEALKQAVAKYKIGDVVEGDITGVVDFGAFVKLDIETDLEGLIHISEIDWTLIEDPRSVLKAGDRVKAKVIDVQGGKISLSLKALKEDPWIKIAEQYKKGDTARAKAVKFNPFGAFAELESGIQGLVHISEFGTEKRMREELELGKTYDFKVLLIDPKEHRMSLGMIHEEKIQNPETQNQDKTQNTDTPKTQTD